MFFKCNKAGSVKYFLSPIEIPIESVLLAYVGNCSLIFGVNWLHLPQLDELTAELLDDSF